MPLIPPGAHESHYSGKLSFLRYHFLSARSSPSNRLSRMDLRKFPGILKQKIMTGRGQASEGLKVGHGGQRHKNSYSARLYGTESRLCLAACTRTAVASTT